MQETKLYNKIKTLQTLWPGNEVNTVMSELTEYCCTNSHTAPLLSNIEIEFIRNKSNIAEVNLEKFWALNFIKSNNLNIKDFIYHNNYSDLINLEISNILIYKKDIKNVLFIGGGPLPVSAILLANNFKYNITILEKDERSYNISKDLINKLKLNKKIKLILKLAEEYNDYDQYDLIYLAAMVGNSQKEKDILLNKISMKSNLGSLIIIRSAFAMKKLLYITYNFVNINNLKLLTEVRPHNHIVNSFFVLQKI